jgi:hypothetical protein
MAKVIEYIDRWKEYHSSRVAPPIGGWPPVASPFWRTFRDDLIRAQASEVTANAASDANAATPAKAQADTVRAFRDALALVVDTKGQTGGMTRDEAHAASQALSRDQYGDPMPCEACGGEGLAYYVRSDLEPIRLKTAGGLWREVQDLPMCCPGCPMGRWMAAHSRRPDAKSVLDDDEAKKRKPRITRRDVALGGDDDATTPTTGNASAFKAGLATELTPARAGVPF